MATLQDIADRVGVSKVTVSNVLRGKVQGRGARTAAQVKRIREVAEELNYRVDWRARALKTKRTQMIGLLSMREEQFNMHNEQLFLALLSSLTERGYSLVMVQLDATTHGGSGFDDARFDGLLIDYFITPAEVAAVQRADVPALIINAPSLAGIESVMPDHHAAGRMAARALLEAGHRRIAHVRQSADQRAIWPQHMGDAWAAGIRAELEAAGLGDELLEIMPETAGSDEHERYYRPAIEAAVAAAVPPTAYIVDTAKHAANAVLRNLTALGVRCPEDASVLCLEDLDACTWIQPALTCLRVDYAGLGRAAAAELVARIENTRRAPAADADRFPTRLVWRDSVTTVEAPSTPERAQRPDTGRLAGSST